MKTIEFDSPHLSVLITQSRWSQKENGGGKERAGRKQKED
jgi:hypothetical protein